MGQDPTDGRPRNFDSCGDGSYRPTFSAQAQNRRGGRVVDAAWTPPRLAPFFGELTASGDAVARQGHMAWCVGGKARMALDPAAILRNIDAVLREAQNVRKVARPVQRVRDSWSDEEERPTYAEETDTGDISRASLLILSALKKYARSGSPYVEQGEAVLKQLGPSNDYGREQLLGILRALRFEYETGALLSIEELVHADLFADFLQMARHQVDKGFKDPAAVLASGVFEQHLRRLAEKHHVPTVKANGEPKNSESINQELAKAGAYDTATQKEVTAKLDLRNKAAHGEWDKYEATQVALLIDWVSFFAQKHPA